MTFHTYAWCINSRNYFKNWDFHFTEGESKEQECEWTHSGHKASLLEHLGTHCGCLTLMHLCPASLRLYFFVLVLSMGGAAGTIQARQSDQVIAQPAHWCLEKFLPNHQPSWGFSGNFVSRAPNMLKDVRTWATIAPLTNLGLTSVGGCWARCTQLTHCQEVVLAFVHAPGYFTECHHLVMKCSPVTMAHEHRNSLCP